MEIKGVALSEKGSPISPEAQTVRTARDPDRPIDYVAILDHVTRDDLGILGERLHIDGLRFGQLIQRGADDTWQWRMDNIRDGQAQTFGDVLLRRR